eukprot:6178190-Ditylum_brightwellii.AAC.1
MEESSASVLMAEMKDYTSVHTVEDKRKQQLCDNHITSSNYSKMLLNEMLHNKNQEKINLIGCENVATFDSKLETHFITYFKQQDVNTRLCGLHSLNNSCNKRAFSGIKQKMMSLKRMIWKRMQKFKVDF